MGSSWISKLFRAAIKPFRRSDSKERQLEPARNHRPTRWALGLESLEDRLAPAVQPISLADPTLWGASGNSASSRPSISDDGQRVAFESIAGNLVTNDLNGVGDIYVSDVSGQVVLVSLATGGNAGNGMSQNPRISGDGRFVVFESDATDLVAGDTNGQRDVFVRDLVNHTTARISVTSAGVQGNGASSNAMITPDGRFVAYQSTATNLTAGNDNSSASDIFLRDLINHSTVLVSVQNSDATTGNSNSTDPAITPDGRFVVFVSSATDLTADPDINGNLDIFVRDVQSSATDLVSMSVIGSTANAASAKPLISANGRFVAFESRATNLTANDSDSFADIFLRDLLNDSTTLISVSDAGINVPGDALNPVMSGDANVIGFTSNAANLVAGVTDVNGTYDVFVRDRQASSTRLVSISASGSAGNGISGGDGGGSVPNIPLALSSNGQRLAFVSAASNLVSGDGNNAADVFVHDLSANTTMLASISGGSSGNGASGNGTTPTIALSADGQFLAFQSSASNLVIGDNAGQDVFLRDLPAATTSLVSTRSFEMPPEFTANNDSQVVGVSPNSRFVLFLTSANNVVMNLTYNSGNHLYWHDRQTGETKLIDFRNTTIAAGNVATAAVSDDGRYVAFQSDASVNNLVAAGVDGNGLSGDVYLRDLQTDQTRLVSVSTGSGSGNSGSTLRGLSADGQVVLFESRATDLIAGFVDGNGPTQGDVFARRMTTGSEQTFLVSAVPGSPTLGGNSESNNGDAVLSADGAKVAFASRASNLVAGFTDGNSAGQFDIFLRELASATTTLVTSASSNATTSANASSSLPAFSADGNRLAFLSSASNLVTGQNDANGSTDVFVRDLAAHVTFVASGQNGSAVTTGNSAVVVAKPSISGDGRYVAFSSFAGNLVSGDSNGLADVFVRDTQSNATILASTSTAGTVGNGSSTNPTLSNSGRFVAFLSTATNLVTGFADGNTAVQRDAFVRDLQAGGAALLTVNISGTSSGNNDTNAVLLSGDGSLAVVQSHAADLFRGDRNARPAINGSDVFAIDILPPGAIRGRVYHDLDGDGNQDVGENGMSNWTVFMDDGDGILEPGETFVVTATNGDFAFNGVPVGNYTIAVVVVAGYEPTAPQSAIHDVTLANNGDVVLGRNFGVRALLADLAVNPVSAGLTTIQLGRDLTVGWRVTNVGGVSAGGSWQDAVYLSADDTLDAADTLLGVVPHATPLNAGLSYDASLTVGFPAVAPGTYRVLVQTDRRNQVAEGGSAENNHSASAAIMASVPALVLNSTFTDAFHRAGDEHYYQVIVPAGESLLLQLDSTASEGGTELLVRRLPYPTEQDNDFRSSTLLQSPDSRVVVPLTQAGTYYVAARANFGAAAVNNYTLTASLQGVTLHSIAGTRGGNTGNVTLTLRGSGFTSALQARLLSGPSTIPAHAVDVRDGSLAYATFNLNGADLGVYDAAIQQPSGIASIAAAFTVEAGITAEVSTQVSLPAGVRDGRTGVAVVSYENKGNTDVPAPLLELSADYATLKLVEQDDFVGNVIRIIGLNPNGPAGILAPGDKGQVLVVFKPVAPIDVNQASFELHPFIIPDRAIDWVEGKSDGRSEGIAADAWSPIYDNMAATFGNTLGTYQQAIAENATYLARLGAATYDVSRIVSFILGQANNSFGGQSVSEVDASYPAPGLELAFSRSFASSITGRYRENAMGRGWTFTGDSIARTDPNGDVRILSGAGNRLFTLLTNGSYQTQPGDYATLTRPGGMYRIREADGLVFTFRVDGKPSALEDTHGNRISYGYDARDRLVTLTHSSGQALTIAYDGQDRIASVSDPAGRTTLFGYDGDHLVSATDATGTTTYTYVTGQGEAREHALASITTPDGLTQQFRYDVRGRLAGVLLNDLQQVSLAYGPGAAITATNAVGKSTLSEYDDASQLRRRVDALGRETRFEYDDHHQLVQSISPAATRERYTYDGRGNPISVTDPLNQRVEMTYESTFNRLTSIRDARGNVTRYNIDPVHGDVRSIIYPDSSVKQLNYDPLGNLTDTINRRGHPIRFTYDSRGLVTRKVFADLSEVTYVYDTRGNLTKATDDSGDTVFQYDATDRLTFVQFPTGRSLAFTYDAGGRRTRSLDQDGFIVQYAYDGFGRLGSLRDGAGQRIVQYTYDDAGQLVRKDLGNLTFTTYTYDAAGQLLSLVNHAPDNSVNSFFTYTYDILGRRTTVTTADGTTMYGYDDLGQLTDVALPQGRTIHYAYDAAGNRTSVTDDGVTTLYVANSLNQYTSVGSMTLTYDLDGNLASRTEPGGATQYTFDDENHLLSVQSPGDDFAYEYDFSGQRTAITKNGIYRTEFTIDPFGLGNIVAEHNASGDLVARFVHGFGLVSRGDVAASTTAYYDFDAVGSTVGISDSTGEYVNRYAYLPFGESTTLASAVPNHFTFVGAFGLVADDSGFIHMRHRDYSLEIGQFISEDPIGLLGGDSNVRRYVRNDPVLQTDASGLNPDAWALYRQGLVDTLQMREMVNPGLGNKITSMSAQGIGQSLEVMTADVQASAVADSLVGKTIGFTSTFEADVGAWVAANEAALARGAVARGTLVGLAAFAGDWLGNELGKLFSNTDLGKQINEGLYKLLEPQLEGIAKFLLPFYQAFLRIFRSHDPNDMVGPGGYGAPGYIAPGVSFPYTVHFENDPQKASVPAQDVTIEVPLDPDLDWSTFELGSFGFGSIVVDVPRGLRSYQTTIAYQNRDGSPLNVHVSAAADLETGLVTWQFRSLDPATGIFPEDLFAGFLPPEDGTGAGQGFLNYNVHAKSVLASGTAIDAAASIVFDVNPPLATNNHHNTIDAGVPSSSVQTLPDVSQSTFTVSWTGDDDVAGSGIGTYELYVSESGGPWTLWHTSPAAGSTNFTGQAGHSYAFYSVARDNVGNRQATPSGAQSRTTVNSPPNTPVDDDLAPNLIPEGAANGTSVKITARANDLDNQTITFRLTDDAGGRFAINGSTGVVLVANGSLLNYETATSHEITVEASDAMGGRSTQSFTVNIANVSPTMPTDVDGTANQVSANAPNGTLVGITASSQDPHGPAVTYSLTNSAGGRFMINANTGVVSVANSSLLVGNTIYQVTVEASDGAGGLASATYSINVLPTASALTLLDELIADIKRRQQTGLNHGQTNSLIAKLNNARKSLEKGNRNAAINQIRAFQNEVSALSGHILAVNVAENWLGQVTEILDQLCYPGFRSH